LESLRGMWKERAGLQFCALFVVWLGGLALLFELLRMPLVDFYMYPISYAAAWLLTGLGIDARLGEALLATGVCQLAVRDIVYLVTFECTGIFALFMCLAAVLAYPASLADKAKGVALVLPAFIVYSTLRLTIMGLVARFVPAQIELFHVYIMVLVNIGFVLFLWMYWVREVVVVERREIP
jgi:exosortase/archaeosortase family protein